MSEYKLQIIGDNFSFGKNKKHIPNLGLLIFIRILEFKQEPF